MNKLWPAISVTICVIDLCTSASIIMAEDGQVKQSRSLAFLNICSRAIHLSNFSNITILCKYTEINDLFTQTCPFFV